MRVVAKSSTSTTTGLPPRPHSLYGGHECSSRPFRMSQETIARVELAEDSPSFAVLQR
jgi:hypothetical protein